jgi:hypothetical protein
MQAGAGWRGGQGRLVLVLVLGDRKAHGKLANLRMCMFGCVVGWVVGAFNVGSQVPPRYTHALLHRATACRTGVASLKRASESDFLTSSAAHAHSTFARCGSLGAAPASATCQRGVSTQLHWVGACWRRPMSTGRQGTSQRPVQPPLGMCTSLYLCIIRQHLHTCLKQ